MTAVQASAPAQDDPLITPIREAHQFGAKMSP